MKWSSGFVYLAFLCALLVVGCQGWRPHGQLTEYDQPEDTTTGDDGTDGGTVDGGSGGGTTGGGTTGGGTTSAFVPSVSFDYEQSAASLMSSKSVTATFQEAVDDCNGDAVNDLILFTDDAGAPIECTHQWNLSCTELQLKEIPLTYFTKYKILLKQGLSFQGEILQSDLTYEFQTLANYYSSTSGRYADYPTILREDTMSPYWGVVYPGSDMLPAVLPRDPIEFWPEDIAPPSFEYQEENVWVGRHLNAGDGRFIFSMENSWTEQKGVMLWRSLSSDPIFIFTPGDVGTIAFTDQSDSEAISFNGNSVQDVAFSVYNTAWDRIEIYVFYDWQNETSDLTYEDADWALITNVYGDGLDAGDFNNDGKADLCLLDASVELERGTVLCYFGGASGLSADPDVTFLLQVGDAPYDLNMGDVNCDGYSDVVTGGEAVDESWVWIGAVKVFPGGSDVSGDILVGEDLDAALEIRSASTLFGSSYFAVNDVNGDGCSDIFVQSGDKMAPDLYAFKGVNSISYGDPQIVDAATAASVIFADADGANIGQEIVTYLDLNGDGYNDLMYREVVSDFELEIWTEEQLFVPGGADFFGPDQVTRSRADSSAQFLVLSGPMAF